MQKLCNHFQVDAFGHKITTKVNYEFVMKTQTFIHWYKVV